MSRKLTPTEQNKVKNLQVSNSIYRKDIKNLETELVSSNEKLEDLKTKVGSLIGEEHQNVSREIDQLEAHVKDIIGKIAYKEGRIKGKEVEIEDIKNQAAREEEEVISYDPNDPEILAKKEAEKAEKVAKKETNKKARSRTKTDPAEVTTEM